MTPASALLPIPAPAVRLGAPYYYIFAVEAG